MPKVNICWEEWYPVLVIETDEDGTYYEGDCNVTDEFILKYESVISDFKKLQNELESYTDQIQYSITEQTLLKYVDNEKATDILSRHKYHATISRMIDRIEESAEYSVRASSLAGTSSELEIEDQKMRIIRNYILEQFA